MFCLWVYGEFKVVGYETKRNKLCSPVKQMLNKSNNTLADAKLLCDKDSKCLGFANVCDNKYVTCKGYVQRHDPNEITHRCATLYRRKGQYIFGP